ncbi:MAG TPA: DoxX family protein [Aquabacterium sp.]|uniref:DoxX family protein n=1 Tax=Aquabacterium sp. TaxID=1872578 RepID=UPI002E3278BB|nr:DoxX family protein [Aquabacterium sp.]HEX5356286.1 DoxX family protein [Aquabacterium sp.]
MLTTSTSSDSNSLAASATAGKGLRPRVLALMHAWLKLEVWPQALTLLAARLYLFDVFFTSGLTKVRDWDATLFLFSEEYHVPVLPPELAAWMGTGGELGFSVLLALGLLTRPAAVGLFFVNAMAVISYPDLAPAALKDHHLWGVLALVLACFGAGRLSLDSLAWRRWLNRG